jgi:hypothetical protein
VLLAAAGKQDKDVAADLGITAQKVARWSKRFLALGMAGLEKDAPRPGRTPSISAAKVKRVIQKTTQEIQMHLKPGDEADTALANALQHEFLRCQDAFKDFERCATFMIHSAAARPSDYEMQSTDRLLAYHTYNAYSRFVHHLYEFLIGAAKSWGAWRHRDKEREASAAFSESERPRRTLRTDDQRIVFGPNDPIWRRLAAQGYL